MLWTGWLARQGFFSLLSAVRKLFSPKNELYFVSNFSTLDLVDRERFTRRLMPLVRKNHEVHQRGEKRVELVVLLLAEAGVEKRFDSADDARCGDGGSAWRRPEELPGLFVEAPGEVVEELDASSDGGFARSARLDHEGAGRVRLAPGEAQQRFEAAAHTVAPS